QYGECMARPQIILGRAAGNPAQLGARSLGGLAREDSPWPVGLRQKAERVSPHSLRRPLWFCGVKDKEGWVKIPSPYKKGCVRECRCGSRPSAMCQAGMPFSKL